MAVYQPKLVRQIDGSSLGPYNCTMASGAMALDRHTLGKKLCTGAKMRSHSGDTSGGTNLMQLDYAWHRGHTEDLDVRLRIPWNDFVALVSGGRGAVLQLWYGTLGSYRWQTNFYGNHAVYINDTTTMRDPRTGSTVAAGRMYDPLGSIWRLVPLSVLKAAAGSLQVTSSSRVGLGYCYAGYTRRVGLTTGTTAPSGAVPTLILTKPPTPAEVNPMIPGGGIYRTSSHVKLLKAGQPLYRTPGGALATKMSKDAAVEYFGPAGNGWHCVEVFTGAPYADKVGRNTLVYVPSAAGPVRAK